MAESINDVIPENITDLFSQIQGKIDGLDTQVGKILQVHENEFLDAYRIHMFEIQKEIKVLKFNISQEELKRRRDEEILVREKERDWFREEALRLNKVCKEHMKSAEMWKAKARMLEEDKKLLEDKLRGLNKKVEKVTEVRTVSPLKLSEPGKSFITESATTLNVKSDSYYEVTISHLKKELNNYKTLVKQVRGENSSVIARRHQLETLFEECVIVAQEDAKQNSESTQKLFCAEFEGLEEPTKRKILYLLVSRPEVAELVKSFVFRTRTSATPSKYLQRNSTSSHGLRGHVFSTPKRRPRVRHLPYYN